MSRFRCYLSPFNGIVSLSQFPALRYGVRQVLRKLLSLVILIFIYSIASPAQVGTIIVTAEMGSSYAEGSIHMQQVMPYPNTPVGLRTQLFDASGNFTYNLPAGGTWQFTFCNTANVCFTAQAFINTTTDVTTQFTAAASGGGGSPPAGNTGDLQCKGASGFNFCGSGAGALTSNGSGLVTHTETGSFSSAQWNDYNLFSVGTSCSPVTILNAGGGAFNLTNAGTGCVRIPSSGVSNAFSVGLNGLAENDNACTTCGQFGGPAEAAGLNGSVYLNANNAEGWSLSLGASDAAGNTNNVIFGIENDITVNNNSTSGAGALWSFRGNGQPTNYNFPALQVQTPIGTGTFTDGLEFQDGSIAIGPDLIYKAIRLGQATAGTSATSSESIQWNAHDTSTAISHYRQLNKDDVMFDVGFPLNQFNTAGDAAEAYAISLESTSAIAVHKLVKIDIAHADSVVICTTADTTCHGFIAEGTNVASSLCGASGIACPVVATSGSKVKGIVGTGTCAIGNNVIVDTTTNGDVKCQAAVPAQGAWIGIALSAQGSVGGTVDILTKFQ